MEKPNIRENDDPLVVPSVVDDPAGTDRLEGATVIEKSLRGVAGTKVRSSQTAYMPCAARGSS